MTNSCSRLPKDYFIPVHPIINLIIIIGLFGFVQLMALQPSYLLHFGTFGKFLHDFTVIYPAQTQLFYRICMFIHCAESSVAFIYASIIHQLKDFPIRLGLKFFGHSSWIRKIIFCP